MSEEWEAYVNDPRTVCKYGAKCYQKNPDHHKTYKHPPQKLKKKCDNGDSPPHKRLRPPKDKKEVLSPEKKEDLSPKRKADLSPDMKEDLSPKKNPDNDGDKTQDNQKIEPPSSSEDATVTNLISLPDTLSYYDKDTDCSIIKELFLVEMPQDFYRFYECLKTEPDLEKTLGGVNLELIGPYDLLLGKLPILDNKELYLVHWRFFFDPPEFQSVIKKKGKSEYHIGYFRDDPESPPVFLANNDSVKGYHITPMAENIFAAVYLYLQNEKKSSPFTSVACQKLMEKVKTWAETHNYSLEEYNIKKRYSQMVTKTFHGAGIVVPYNKKTQLGYRRLVETDAIIKKMFTRLQAATSQREKDKILSELQPVITYASIAVDECDFGTGLEVGIDLFCSGLKELQPNVLSSLTSVYPLLKREAFSRIIQAHIKYRRKGPNMSIVSK